MKERDPRTKDDRTIKKSWKFTYKRIEPVPKIKKNKSPNRSLFDYMSIVF